MTPCPACPQSLLLLASSPLSRLHRPAISGVRHVHLTAVPCEGAHSLEHVAAVGAVERALVSVVLRVVFHQGGDAPELGAALQTPDGRDPGVEAAPVARRRARGDEQFVTERAGEALTVLMSGSVAAQTAQRLEPLAAFAFEAVFGVVSW